MPRIRTIKPEFWNDQKLGQEPEAVMLVYIGLWNFSDDYGVVKGNSVWLKNQIFPYKDKLRIDAFSTWLDRLAELEVIIPFTYKSESFYYIRTFRKHQKVDKPSKARNCNEGELIRLMESQGFHFQTDGELLKHSTSTRRVFDEGSPQEIVIVREVGEGREEGIPAPPSGSVLKNIDALKDACLNDRIHFVEHVMRQNRISEIQLITAMDVFNDHLKSGSEFLKQEKDYRFHFQNWLKKQDTKQFRVNPQQKPGSNGSVLKSIGL
jgi:hypothetical protein